VRVTGPDGPSGLLSGVADAEGRWAVNLGNVKEPTTGEPFLYRAGQMVEVMAAGGPLGGVVVQGVLTEANPQRIDGTVVTGVPEEAVEASGVPATFTLEQNIPNPFNAGTVVTYRLPALAHVVVRIYNLAGQEVSTLVDRTEVAGDYRVWWDGRDTEGQEVASGIYIVRLQAETGGAQQWINERRSLTATRKMVLMR
jgi:hypothetical protein